MARLGAPGLDARQRRTDQLGELVVEQASDEALVDVDLVVVHARDGHGRHPSAPTPRRANG
jgi:hypothetical protein